MISRSISYYNKNGQVTTSLKALGSLEGSMPLVTTYENRKYIVLCAVWRIRYSRNVGWI